MRTINCFILLLLLLPSDLPGQNDPGGFRADGAHYLWPINAGNYLSSTFGETRSSHFHSALDLKTWGRRGYRVVASRDGTLYRLAIGPRGYGKVLYLQHNDGTYSVYAHLLAFEERIQQLADSLRFEDYSFELDRFVGNRGISVKQGELIGLSGASGIGPPHLHFELRTPRHRPFNPLLTNLNFRDGVTPQFSGLSAEPLSIRSRIEGINRIYTRKAWREGENYTFGTIEAEGPIGLGVNVFDQADEVHNAYAVYELKMFVDDRLLFHSRVDSFSYSNTRQMFIDRVYPLLQKTGAGYQRLYIAEGNTLPFYTTRDCSARLDLAPGRHEVRIEAGDFHGNTATAHLTLNVQQPAPEQHASKRPNAHRTDGGSPDTAHSNSVRPNSGQPTPLRPNAPPMDPAGWEWHKSWVNIPRSQASSLLITPLGSGIGQGREEYQGREEDQDRKMIRRYSGPDLLSFALSPHREVLFRGPGRRHLVVELISRESPTFIGSTSDRSFARFGSNAFYETAYGGLMVDKYRSDSVRVQLLPSGVPPRGEFLLAVELDSMQQSLDRLGIYEWEEPEQKLDYLQTDRKRGYLMARPDRMGTFYVLRDTVAPQLRDPRLVQRLDGQWLIHIESTDNLSGIDHRTARGHVNGVRGIMEFEPEDDRLVYYHPDFVPQEENSLHLSVRDRAGNRAAMEVVIPRDEK